MILKEEITHWYVSNFNDDNYPFFIETFQEEPFNEVILYLQKERINSPPKHYNTDDIKTLNELESFITQLIRSEKIKKINDNIRLSENNTNSNRKNI